MTDSLYSNLHRVLNLNYEHAKEEAHDQLGPWLLWRIWKNRNEFIYKGKDYDAPSMVRKAREDMEEWRSRKEVEESVVKNPIRAPSIERWKPPPQNWIKCNTDGAWKKDSESCGVGWVSRDQSGKLVWAGARELPTLGSPIKFEAEAIRWAIHTLVGFNYQQVIVETDSLELTKMINGTEAPWPKLRPIIQDISNMLVTKEAYRVEFFPLSGNKVTDRTAKESLTFMSHVPKLYFIVPVWLSSLLEADKLL